MTSNSGTGPVTSPTTTTDDTTGSESQGADSTSTTGEEESTGCVISTWFLDEDGDGHGNPDQAEDACEAPPGYVALGDDCDDTDENNNPSMDEQCDGQDNDCDVLIDEFSPSNANCNGCTLGTNGESFYAYCQNPLSFFDARTSCVGFGGDLVKIDDIEENSFLVTETLRLPDPPRYYMGLSDQLVEGQFIWLDGSVPGFTNWAPGEPNDVGTGEDCAELMGGDTWNGIWNDIPCETPYKFICESSSP